MGEVFGYQHLQILPPKMSSGEMRHFFTWVGIWKMDQKALLFRGRRKYKKMFKQILTFLKLILKHKFDFENKSGLSIWIFFLSFLSKQNLQILKHRYWLSWSVIFFVLFFYCFEDMFFMCDEIWKIMDFTL